MHWNHERANLPGPLPLFLWRRGLGRAGPLDASNYREHLIERGTLFSGKVVLSRSTRLRRIMPEPSTMHYFLIGDDGAIGAIRILPGIGINERNRRSIGLQIDPMDQIGGSLDYEVVAGHSGAAHIELPARIARGEGNWWRAQSEEPLPAGGGVVHVRTDCSGQIRVGTGGAGRGLENEWRRPSEP